MTVMTMIAGLRNINIFWLIVGKCKLKQAHTISAAVTVAESNNKRYNDINGDDGPRGKNNGGGG